MRRGVVLGLAGLTVAAGTIGTLTADRILERRMTDDLRRNMPYEVTVGGLIQNPDLFDNAYLYVFEDEHRETVMDASGKPIDYVVIARYSIDAENFVRGRFCLSIVKPDSTEHEKGFENSEQDSARVADFEAGLKKHAEVLDRKVPGLSARLLSIADRYRGWELSGNGFTYCDWENFGSSAGETGENDLDRHITRTLETDPDIRPYGGEEREFARRLLHEEARKRAVKLDELPPRESMDFLDGLMQGNFSYDASRGPEPHTLTDFHNNRGACADFSDHSSRLFRLMRETNPGLANIHCTGVVVDPGFRYSHIGHGINVFYDTKSRTFTFNDFSKRSSVADLPTVVSKRE